MQIVVLGAGPKVRFPQIVAAALLWQSSLLVNIGAVAAPEHLPYERRVILSQGSGVTCVALDATVLAHTASPAHNDVRLFRELPASTAQAEVPFLLTESGPEPVADTEVAVEHLARSDSELRFDLRMPDRAYSELRLRLRLHDFVGTATVAGRDAAGKHAELGSVGIYDLTGQGLGSWTSVSLAESTWPLLHVTLAFRTPGGVPIVAPPLAVLEGVAVPPSRQRQTRFVPTIRTEKLVQRASQSVATLHVPAHVPVERVSIELPPDFEENFSREVTVTARPDGEPVTNTEALDAGAMAHLRMPSGDPRLNPIDLRQTELDATLGATLAKAATVRVAINNGQAAPLPIRSVSVMMRDRDLCFFADRESNYVLRYGDPGLSAPIYDEAALVVPAQPREARLGPELKNRHFVPRHDERGYLQRHPELFWVAVLLCVGLMGGMALHHVQHRRL